ncbi:NifU family protein [Aureimonas phyllosphaerae]|uniref:Fe-S cluster biogenesis protein NfuA n=1 Tax=Aureimonas phyllosphaerae TaxID=1166078 RepID=A0A7W6FW32_9HYPH|nr:NifU family protein [Aureimonas phyllosphaerae]MBB3937470.1 Fe-S cluster biogenesis protein NfuA [Aureimonas phyllosphaerae]MBB3961464.1 Fe-S cluster biogenesis protein NfuA [Aureimonas phyllosphaerae]SFF38420.1 Fe-S cluster biogenesis protein NfuA, 4Fe-4S-binding domain [Aureimonas phyllosphaerae]
MFIQTESTPNPQTLKFLPGRVVLENGTAEFLDAADAAARSKLAAKLMGIEGVRSVFFGYDFVTVTKDETGWQHLKPAILAGLMEHFLSGEPVMAPGAAGGAQDHDSGEEFFEPGDETVVSTIKELLETRVRPAVAQDGGDITFRGFRDGVVFLNMRGSCAGCPSSTATLKHGIENLLRHFVPEVEAVEAMEAA